MILGSMAPDFEYFLRGRPYGIYGHTLLGIILFDLPLVVAVYFMGKYLVQPAISPYLPYAFQPKQLRSYNRISAAFIFVYSALFGVLSHIMWDSFTHGDRAMVKHVAMLDATIRIFGWTFPYTATWQYADRFDRDRLVFIRTRKETHKGEESYAHAVNSRVLERIHRLGVVDNADLERPQHDIGISIWHPCGKMH